MSEKVKGVKVAPKVKTITITPIQYGILVKHMRGKESFAMVFARLLKVAGWA